ncbi:MAG: putative ABC transporter permease [Oscillospiraceae bacterium]|nr:putative ABC transporter permease [Oscillospiraceae bacterium]
MDYNLYTYGLILCAVSVLGFVLENVWLAVRSGYIDNRNMTLPFLLGYGIFIIALYKLIGVPENISLPSYIPYSNSKFAKRLIYFILAFVIVSISEIALGNAVEKLCGFYYWNYETLPMHITRYTSVPTSCAFAFIITFFMDKCFEPMMSAFSKINHSTAVLLSTSLTVLMAADFIKSFHTMYKKKALNTKWRINIGKKHSLKTVR